VSKEPKVEFKFKNTIQIIAAPSKWTEEECSF
jgi:hypothetical protein